MNPLPPAIQQAAAKRRLRTQCSFTDLAKLLTTRMVAALFAAARALPFDLMLAYPRPVKPRLNGA